MGTLRIRGLTKQLGDTTVVREVDLDVAEGELVVIVGPSGCGKSTLLRMIAGLETPSSGVVMLDGEPIGRLRSDRWPVAMMFQEAALYPHLTARGNIGFPLRVAGVHPSTIRDEVDSIAATLGIRPLLARRPGKLSGGQRQRVAMARSLVRRPEVLLMDEPMSNLDAKLRGELRAAIGHLQSELGLTTVYVTHDQVEAMALGHRIAVMRDGEFVQVGTPDHVYAEPVDAFVAGFVGTPTMNLFAGRVRRNDIDAPTVDVGSLRVPLPATRWPDLRDLEGREVVVGIRPHAFRFGTEGAVVDVEYVEYVGDRRMVEAKLPAARVTVTSEGVAIGHAPAPIVVDAAAGDDLGEGRWRASHVAVDPCDIHLFDPESGRSLREQRRTAAAQRMRATT